MTGLCLNVFFEFAQDSFLDYVLWGRINWILFIFWLLFYIILRYRTQERKRIISLGLMLVIWVLISIIFIVYVSSFWILAAQVSTVYLLIQSFIICTDLVMLILEQREIERSNLDSDLANNP